MSFAHTQGEREGRSHDLVMEIVNKVAEFLDHNIRIVRVRNLVVSLFSKSVFDFWNKVFVGESLKSVNGYAKRIRKNARPTVIFALFCSKTSK